MRMVLQALRADKKRLGRRLYAAVGFVTAALIGSPTEAASLRPTPPAPPTPVIPSPTPLVSDPATAQATLDLGANFLERLSGQATNGLAKALRTNPGGGGASEGAEQPRYRSWAEAYGLSVQTGAQGNFVGDHRTTWGGVAGIGARLAPGVNIGLSVDQSRTAVDVPLALQSATLDLTQIGFSASVDKGPWTWALALVHGFGDVNSRRDTGGGIATAGYGARIDGALTELDYFWSLDQSRIVPKIALEYTHAASSALQEAGGLDPVSASRTGLERTRVLAGAEIGHYVIDDGRILDLSAYGKFVDNVSQNFGSIVVSLGAESIALQGVGESRYGADAGAAASLYLTNRARIYLNYDGKFRSALQSHQGTLGVEFKW